MSQSSSPRPRSGVAAALLEKLELDELLNRAFHQLGLTQEHFEEREYNDFREDGASKEIVALRVRHWEKRRKDLKEELDERYRTLVSEANKPKKAAPGPKDAAAASSPRDRTDPSSLLAKDVRKMEMLARKRQEGITKVFDFQMKQRENEQKAEARKEAEREKLEEEKRAAIRRARERLEAKQAFEERKREEERQVEAAAEAKRKLERARAREKAREDAHNAKVAKRLKRQQEEEKKALQLARRRETERKFEEYEARLQERAAAADERKREHHQKFLEQQAETRRMVAEKQAKAKERVDAAQAMQERMAEEARRAFEEKERQAEERREMEARQHEIEMRQRADQQVAMALRRGMILEGMRQQEAGRVFELIERMGKQEQAMEAMAEQRRQMAEVREEHRRLRQMDYQDNIERRRRASEYRGDELRHEFKLQDEKEAARKAGKAHLVEMHRRASLQATLQRQELVDKLAKARSTTQLERLNRELSQGGMLSQSPSAATEPSHGSGAATALPERPASARKAGDKSMVPKPPSAPRGDQEGRPSTARARLA